ncbi:MAG: ATP-binding protein, partial [Bulleidia sp.]
HPRLNQRLQTGYSCLHNKGILHSGAGRISRLRMRPMSLFESGDSSGEVSLEKLCNNELSPVMTGEVSLQKLIQLILRGGWPASVHVPDEHAILLPEEYLKAVIDDDVYRIDGVRRNTGKMWLLLRSLARNESTTVSNGTLRKDIRDMDDEDIDVETVKEYLDIFDRLFITDNQPPFSSGVRSSVRIKQAVKRHFSDPSLACALLKVTSSSLLKDLETLGFLFESLCERDLKIYAESFGGKLYHYQDYRGKEIDAVIEMPNGNWCAFEIKPGANQIDSAAENLLNIRKAFEKDPKGKSPSVLCVISGMSNAAYQRPDGVYVVPITALKN